MASPKLTSGPSRLAEASQCVINRHRVPAQHTVEQLTGWSLPAGNQPDLVDNMSISEHRRHVGDDDRKQPS
jgi:hypothetical protein